MTVTKKTESDWRKRELQNYPDAFLKIRTMGTLYTKESSDELNTPPKNPAHKRILDIDFDPRSPSSDISRTPIAVDKTPEGLLDPRSPTFGIPRTPITSNMNDHGHGLETAPLVEDNGPDIDNELFDKDEVFKDLKKQLSDVSTQQFQKMSIADNKKSDDTLQLIYHDKEDTVVNWKTSSKPAQPKQLFPASKRLPSFDKDVTRSPLSTRNIDTNSPLNIVQKKQSKKVDKYRSCKLESIGNKYSIDDKENINM